MGVQSSPIDLDDLAARLEVVSADRKAPPQLASPASSTTTTYDDEEKYCLDLEDETEFYNTIIHLSMKAAGPHTRSVLAEIF